MTLRYLTLWPTILRNRGPYDLQSRVFSVRHSEEALEMEPSPPSHEKSFWLFMARLELNIQIYCVNIRINNKASGSKRVNREEKFHEHLSGRIFFFFVDEQFL